MSKAKIWEKERIYNALTSYDSVNGSDEKTKINVNMLLFKAGAKLEEYKLRTGYGNLARIISVDGMCQMNMDIAVKGSKYVYELEFYDILSINSFYGPRVQKIYEDLSQYVNIDMESLPDSVEEFVNILIDWFEKLQPLLDRYRIKRAKALEKEQEELKDLIPANE